MSAIKQQTPEERAVVEAALAWRTAILASEDLRDELVKVLRAGADAGISEERLARAAEVTRGSVRRWLGKKS